MKKLALLYLFSSTIVGNINSQEVDKNENSSSIENDIIITNSNDTIVCFITDIANLGGKTTKIHYKINEGETKSLWGKEVKEFTLNGYNMVQIPLNSNKPDGYTRHYRRIYNGSIQIFIDAYYASTYNSKKNIREIYTSCISCERSWDKGFDRKDNIIYFSFKLPSGKFCDIYSKKDYEEYLVPFLMKCNAVKERFQDGIKFEKNKTRTTDDITEALNLYINNCENNN